MRQTILRSFYQDEHPMMECALISEAAWQETVVGFRLVHDGGERTLRGSRWAESEVYAPVSEGWVDTGDQIYLMSGFRLAFDREDT